MHIKLLHSNSIEFKWALILQILSIYLLRYPFSRNVNSYMCFVVIVYTCVTDKVYLERINGKEGKPKYGTPNGGRKEYKKKQKKRELNEKI